MSTGELSISIYIDNKLYKLEGMFNNGIIIKGSIKSASEFASGTFDEKMKLHGPACVLSCLRSEKKGTFEHGNLVDGEISYKDGSVEKGKFAGYYLLEGYRKKDNIEYVGTFNGSYLLTGYIKFGDGTKHEGIFGYNNKLMDGTITHNNGFKARVVFDIIRCLKKCYVDYYGDIHNLSNDQLAMYCSSGDNASLVYDIYKKYMINISASTLLLMKADMIKTNNITERLSLEVIFNNLQHAKNNKPLEHIKEYIKEDVIDPIDLTEDGKMDRHY